MAINDLPTPTDSNQGLRSYREEAASYLDQNERSHGSSCPLEPCEPKRSPCGSPPRFRPTATTTSTSNCAQHPEASSSRCRLRTPSPPEPSKAQRSVSPGGTPDTCAGVALRRGNDQACSTSPRLRVRWADTIVTSIQTRPRTLRKDVTSLFYSRADEKRFRREAERARVENDDWCEQLEEDSLTSLPDSDEENHTGLWSLNRDRKDYGISKAVVVFGEATKTYDGGVFGGCAIEAIREVEELSTFSFDDAAFWNGQLTWS